MYCQYSVIDTMATTGPDEAVRARLQAALQKREQADTDRNRLFALACLCLLCCVCAALIIVIIVLATTSPTPAPPEDPLGACCISGTDPQPNICVNNLYETNCTALTGVHTPSAVCSDDICADAHDGNVCCETDIFGVTSCTRSLDEQNCNLVIFGQNKGNAECAQNGQCGATAPPTPAPTELPHGACCMIIDGRSVCLEDSNSEFCAIIPATSREFLVGGTCEQCTVPTDDREDCCQMSELFGFLSCSQSISETDCAVYGTIVPGGNCNTIGQCMDVTLTVLPQPTPMTIIVTPPPPVTTAPPTPEPVPRGDCCVDFAQSSVFSCIFNADMDGCQQLIENQFVDNTAFTEGGNCDTCMIGDIESSCCQMGDPFAAPSCSQSIDPAVCVLLGGQAIESETCNLNGLCGVQTPVPTATPQPTLMPVPTPMPTAAVPKFPCCIVDDDDNSEDVCIENTLVSQCENAGGVVNFGQSCAIACPEAPTSLNCCQFTSALFDAPICSSSYSEDLCEFIGGTAFIGAGCSSNGNCFPFPRTSCCLDVGETKTCVENAVPADCLGQNGEVGFGHTCATTCVGAAQTTNCCQLSNPPWQTPTCTIAWDQTMCENDGGTFITDHECREDGQCVSALSSCCPEDPFVFHGSPFGSNSPTLCGGHDYNCDGQELQYPCANEGLTPSPVEDPHGRTFWTVTEQACNATGPLSTDPDTQCGFCDQAQLVPGWVCSAPQGNAKRNPPTCPSTCQAQIQSITREALPAIGQCSMYVDHCVQQTGEGETCRIVVAN